MIRESYDLDLICYFPRDDEDAGKTLKEIYGSVKQALANDYYVEEKQSALRLRDKSPESYKADLRIDVVPGRYIDEEKADLFIYQAGAEKDRLKTNLEVHIAHVSKSGVRPAIRLMKLWRVRNGLQIKTFALDLLVIKLLKSKKDEPIDKQLLHLWKTFKETADDLSIEDPANPSGNNLSSMLSTWIRTQLSTVASSTLTLIDTAGWEAVFGKVPEAKTKGGDRVAQLQQAAAVVTSRTRPWSRK